MSCSVPCIVASQSFTAQSAVFGPTTIYTPAADGLFRANIYAESSDTTAGDGLAVKLFWQDDIGTSTGTCIEAVLVNIGGHQAQQVSGVFRAIASTNITLQTVVNGSSIASPYNVYVTIEAL